MIEWRKLVYPTNKGNLILKNKVSSPVSYKQKNPTTQHPKWNDLLKTPKAKTFNNKTETPSLKITKQHTYNLCS
jgi:hypothetical protein